jgi:K+-sensing histidine kinase KdpD
MITYYAPAERKPKSDIIPHFDKFNNDHCFQNMINAMPQVAAVLNEERQLVFSNKVLLDAVGASEFEEIISLRPGEIVNCIRAKEQDGGCGTTKHCSVCGAVNAILESQETNKQAIKECRIRTKVDGHESAMDMLISVTPFEYMNGKFYIFSMTDISNEKRKQALEKIFFHDIINTAGGLQGFISLLKDTNDPAETQQYLGILEGISKELIEEIQEQRELIAAENGDLGLKITDLDSKDIIQRAANHIKHHDVSCCKNIEILTSDNINFESDYTLLKRVLVNMLKNALEATPKEKDVQIQAKEITNNLLEFRVMNPTYMTEETKLQVFQRSFSTKGINRGLGTYSMKLLGERYLKGKVGFTSDEKNGTHFFIRLKKKFNGKDE